MQAQQLSLENRALDPPIQRQRPHWLTRSLQKHRDCLQPKALDQLLDRHPFDPGLQQPLELPHDAPTSNASARKLHPEMTIRI